jgi:coenzyme F420 biosynthesis associated uncharacterized protein
VDGVQLVDWSVATATAIRLVPPGPRLDLADAVETVDDLRRLAIEADGHVAAHTGLPGAGADEPVTVVDRPGWIRSNVAGFADLVDPLLDTVLANRGRSLGPVMTAVGSRATGAEVGVLLSYLATRVLGQFELFGGEGGRLTLVAPNIVVAEQALDVDPHDFRLWVCLHEVTHRTQFAAAPWLHGHVRALLGEYLGAADLDPAALVARLRGALRGLVDTARGRGEMSLLELVQTPAQREVLDRITGLMSLLEGHADVVMDGVGPVVVPSVARIRERFEQRRTAGGGVIDRAVRRLLGLDLKLRQYAEGATFVRAAVAELGMDGFNVVWTSPDLLPTGTEIRNPNAWLARVSRAA